MLLNTFEPAGLLVAHSILYFSYAGYQGESPTSWFLAKSDLLQLTSNICHHAELKKWKHKSVVSKQIKFIYVNRFILEWWLSQFPPCDTYNVDIPAMSLTKMDFCGKISCCNTSGLWGVWSPQGRNDHWSETKPGSMLVNIGAPVRRQHWREILGKIWKKYNCENERNTVDKHWRPVCH